MRITCVIPSLGRGKILCDTIRMLFVQSHKPHEIIIVDQTETYDEEIRRTLSEWSEKGCIRWLHQTEPNASLARNVGALAATGVVLLFLDDDIEIGTDFVAAHARNYGDHKVVGGAAQVLDVGQGGTRGERRRPATTTG